MTPQPTNPAAMVGTPTQRNHCNTSSIGCAGTGSWKSQNTSRPGACWSACSEVANPGSHSHESGPASALTQLPCPLQCTACTASPAAATWSERVHQRWHMTPYHGQTVSFVPAGAPSLASGASSSMSPTRSAQQRHASPPEQEPCCEQVLSSSTPSTTALGFPSQPEHVELSPSHTSHESYSAVPSGRPLQSTGVLAAAKYERWLVKHSRKKKHSHTVPFCTHISFVAAAPVTCRSPSLPHCRAASSHRRHAATRPFFFGVVTPSVLSAIATSRRIGTRSTASLRISTESTTRLGSCVISAVERDARTVRICVSDSIVLAS